MKTATVRDLRNNFAQISKWLSKGESVSILKRGKAFARIVPQNKAGTWLGSMSGTGDLPKDLDEPVPVRWEAAR